jgi:hypothetical protein
MSSNHGAEPPELRLLLKQEVVPQIAVEGRQIHSNNKVLLVGKCYVPRVCDIRVL